MHIWFDVMNRMEGVYIPSCPIFKMELVVFSFAVLELEALRHVGVWKLSMYGFEESTRRMELSSYE